MAAPVRLRATRFRRICGWGQLSLYPFIPDSFAHAFFSSGYPHKICRGNPALQCSELLPFAAPGAMAELGQDRDNNGISLEHKQDQHGLNSHSSPLQGRILQMWALLPVFVGFESTDSSTLSSSYWSSLEQQRYSACGGMTRRMLWGVCSLEADCSNLKESKKRGRLGSSFIEELKRSGTKRWQVKQLENNYFKRERDVKE